MDVPVGIWYASGVIVIIISYLTFWVLNKAYSKKWEESEEQGVLDEQ